MADYFLLISPMGTNLTPLAINIPGVLGLLVTRYDTSTPSTRK